MAAPRFLCKTELAGLSRVALDGRPVLADHERLRAEIAARAPDAALLLAEPVPGNSAISWYAEGNGEAVALTSLSAPVRAEAERRLAAAIAALEPVLADAELGPLARRALVLPEPDRIMVLDGRPVLTGWGLAPPDKAANAAGLAEQVRGVLGRHVPALSGVDSTWFAANGAAAPPPAPAPAFAAAAPAPPAPAPPPPAASAPPPPPVPPQAAVPPPPVPGPEGGRGWWMLPAALGIAILFLVLGFLLAWRLLAGQGERTLTADLLDEERVRAQIELQRQTNRALEEEIERARRALQGDVCRPAGPLAPGQVPPGLTPVPPAALPPPAPAQPAPGAPATPAPAPGAPPAAPGQQGQAVPPATVVPPAGPPTPFRGSLAQLLDQAAVLIVATGPQGGGHGTGFFIAPGLILTNAHVAAPDMQLFALNRAFSGPLPAQIVASTREGGGEPRPFRPDFALLRVTGAPALQPLGLSTEAERLQDVVAAGYPGVIVETDINMRALSRGEVGRVPELVLTTGVISTIQQVPTGLTVMPHTASVSPGNSGGPLVDRCGRVVGVNTFVRAAEGASDRVNYALTAGEALAFLQRAGVQGITPIAGACTPQVSPQALPATPPGAPTPAPGATPPPGGTAPPAPAPPAPAAPAPAAPAAPPAPR